jgi:hypothetical protein
LGGVYICPINLKKFGSIVHSINIFVLKVLPNSSKLLEKRLGNELWGQMIGVNSENFSTEILIRDYYAKNLKKTAKKVILPRFLQN